MATVACRTGSARPEVLARIEDPHGLLNGPIYRLGDDLLVIGQHFTGSASERLMLRVPRGGGDAVIVTEHLPDGDVAVFDGRAYLAVWSTGVVLEIDPATGSSREIADVGDHATAIAALTGGLAVGFSEGEREGLIRLVRHGDRFEATAPEDVAAFELVSDGDTLYAAGHGGTLRSIGPDGVWRTVAIDPHVIYELSLAGDQLRWVSGDSGNLNLGYTVVTVPITGGEIRELAPLSRGFRGTWSKSHGDITYYSDSDGLRAVDGHGNARTVARTRHDARAILADDSGLYWTEVEDAGRMKNWLVVHLPP